MLHAPTDVASRPGSPVAEVSERLAAGFEGRVDSAIAREVVRGLLHERGIGTDRVPASIENEAQTRLGRLAAARASTS
jgi:hypothetical protein